MTPVRTPSKDASGGALAPGVERRKIPRTSDVFPVLLEPWLNQKFLGAPATFGDDRSLTYSNSRASEGP